MFLQVLLAVTILGATANTEDNSSSIGVGTFTFHHLPPSLGPTATPPTRIPSTSTPPPPPAPGKQIPSKAQYTRTAIHIARSLDPEATETINFKTRTGEVATLIVKRRSRTGLTTQAPPPLPKSYSAAKPDAPELSKLADVVSAASHLKTAKALPNFAAVPPPVNIRSSLVRVKPQRAGEGKRAKSLLQVGSDGVPEITGVRVPDDEEDRSHVWRNARVVNGVLVPNKRNAQNPWIPTDETDRVGRVLRYPGSHSYPPALLYSAQSTQTSPRVSFEEGVRTPVSEYAHPELGVQPAGKVAEFSNSNVNSPAGRDLTLASFAQDIHADHSPYVREPALDELEVSSSDIATTSQPLPAVAAPTSGRRSSLGSSVSLTQAPLSQPMRIAPDSYGLASDQYVMRFPHAATGPSYAYRPHHYTLDTPVRLVEDNRPFWERISESFRDSMASSVAHVSQFARPVVEPLMASASKLSYQLGFVNTPHVEDRVGVQAPAAAAALLPALGLVAGGAALGLGAVAVGRYLDVDVMSRRNEENDDDDDEDVLAMEHKRAAETIARMQADQQKRALTASFRHPDDAQKLRRRRRSPGGLPIATDEAVLAAWDWARAPTSCAQRVFCEAVRRRGSDDSIAIVEKQAAGFIKTLHRTGEHGSRLAAHQLEDVLDAVRSDDCRRFQCSMR